MLNVINDKSIIVMTKCQNCAAILDAAILIKRVGYVTSTVRGKRIVASLDAPTNFIRVGSVLGMGLQ